MSKLLKMIENYDNDRSAYIFELENKVKELETKNSQYIHEAFDNAVKADQQKLKDILDGVYDNIGPTNTKEKFISRLEKLLQDAEAMHVFGITVDFTVPTENAGLHAGRYNWSSSQKKIVPW